MKKALFVATILSSAFIFTSISQAHALAGSQSATLTYSGIKITLDGSPVLPCDANGNYVEPFAIDGTTYLPVRAIGNAMGLSVGWDSASSTITLSSGGTKSSASTGATGSSQTRTVVATLDYNDIKISVDGQNVIPVNTDGNPVEPFAIKGTTYLPVRGIASVLGLNVDWDGNTNTVILRTVDNVLESVGAHGVPGVPDGWIAFSSGNFERLADGILDGDVIIVNGQYWCSPDYARFIGNERLISFTDISGGEKTPEEEYVNEFNQNTQVEALVGISALSGIRAELTSKKLYEVMASGGDYSNAVVTDIEVLQYCMPSLPDDFINNPVDGTYDGIRITIKDGEIMMYQQDLIDKGLIDA